MTGIAPGRPLTRAGLLAIGISLLLGSAAAANDKVRVQYPEKSGVVVLIGDITEYLGDQLTIQLRSGPETVRAETILEVETYFTPAHREGLAHLDKGETPQARTSFLAALKEENRRWVKRDILAAIVRCDLRTGNLLAAGQTFAEIVAVDPGTRHWATAPLVWSPTAVGGPLKTQAGKWLVDEQPALQLLGASLLLLDPIHGDRARQVMTDLARSPQRPIAPLARAQMWRMRFQGKALAEGELESWRGEIQHLPVTHRAGPQYLLARGFLSRNAVRDAAAEYLWLPTVYSDLEVLSARALWDAAAALRESAAEAESRMLLRELVERFPWSVEATEARSLLNEKL